MTTNRTRRTAASLGLVLVLLVHTGCGMFSKTKGEGSGRPFTGLLPSDDAPVIPTSGTSDSKLPPRVNGVLAGQVMDNFRKSPQGVVIQVVDLQENDTTKAPLDIYANDDGYFTIQGLDPSRNYKLVARVKEGEKLLTGSVFAQPPNPRLNIRLREDLTGSTTPDIPKPPTWENDNDKGTPTPSDPAASLEPPSGARREGKILDVPAPEPAREEPSSPDPLLPEPSIPDYSGTSSMPPLDPPVDPSRTTRGEGGFLRDPTATIPSAPTMPTVPTAPSTPDPTQPRHLPGAPLSIPGPGATRPTPPAREIEPASLPPTGGTVPSAAVPTTTPVEPAPKPSAPRTPTPASRVPVPSCVLVGKQLHNFALRDLDGEPWEYKRHRAGRLLLLDFWSTDCVPCLRTIPFLEDLQRRYGTRGLQVVGIAYEKGTREQQVRNVKRVKGRLKTSYLTLLGGGGRGACPVLQQFQVSNIPTLVLIDEEGRIIWRNYQGLDPGMQRNLEWTIQRQLQPPRR